MMMMLPFELNRGSISKGGGFNIIEGWSSIRYFGAECVKQAFVQGFLLEEVRTLGEGKNMQSELLFTFIENRQQFNVK